MKLSTRDQVRISALREFSLARDKVNKKSFCRYVGENLQISMQTFKFKVKYRMHVRFRQCRLKGD